MEKTIAYYPGITPLFGGTVSVRKIESEAIGASLRRVNVHGYSSLDFDLLSRVEDVRTVHTAYFSQIGGCPVRVCNVDMELQQPSEETVAKAILGMDEWLETADN